MPIEVLFFGLLIVAIGLFFVFRKARTVDKTEEKVDWVARQKVLEEDAKRQKYNNYKYTCPMCGSHLIKTIGNTKRATSVFVWGAASDKIGRRYQCDDCDYMW